MQTEARASDDPRQIFHLAIGALALLLRFAAWWEAAVLVGMVLTCTLYVGPRVPRLRIYRETERRRRFLSGVALHPLSILVLIFVLPDRRDIVAASWGILAVGDSVATLVGGRAGGPRIPWNPVKTWAGSAAFVVAGGAAAAFLCWWCRPVIVPPPYWWFTLGAPLAAAAAAAAVETIPIGLDDNVSVPAAAAAVLWWLSLLSNDALAELARDSAGTVLPAAVVVNGAAALAGYAARTLTRGGAAWGALLGTTILLTTGWSGWLLLLATFGMAVVTSRLGIRRKARLGIAEERGGRRAGGNAFANTGVAVAAGVLAAASYAEVPALVGFVAALAAGGSDTMASEVGKAWGRRVYLFPMWRPVSPGTPGGISVIGTAAGLAGAAGLGALGAAMGLIAWSAVLPVIAGATAGAFTESALAAGLEARGVVNNDVLNFINTAVAAAVAVLLLKVPG